MVLHVQVEKTSWDDYYLDVTAACSEAAQHGAAQQRQQAAGGLAGALAAEPGPPPSLRFATAAATAAAGASSDEDAGVPSPEIQRDGSQAGTAARGSSQQVQQAQQQCWARLAPDLRRGAALAAALRAAVSAELGGMTVSCGVGRSKLVARQAGPLGKPDGLTGED